METTVDVSNNQEVRKTTLAPAETRMAGLASLIGAIVMIIGAVLLFSTGTDLWAAVDGGDMAGYLTAAGAVKGQLVANLTFWIVGVLILGMAWNALIKLDNQRTVPAQIAGVCAAVGVPLAVVSMLVMMALVVQIAPDTSEISVAMANVAGWIGIRADDLATALIIGLAPFFLSLAARGGWMPSWLAVWGYLAGIVGLLSTVVYLIPSLAGMGLLIVPVGMGWMIAAGIVLLRQK